MASDLTHLKRRLVKAGYTITPTRNRHLAVQHPDKPGTVILPLTPSDHRSLKNATAQLRRTFGYQPK
jgi:predicted RNA binding protein YcfA (HicA-like mRNA interferase family)